MPRGATGWAASGGVGALSKVLEERGLHLAKGGRRAHVVVSFDGEVFALSRLIDKKAKDVTVRLGAPEALPTMAETKARIAGEIAPKLSAYIREAKAIAHKAQAPLEAERRAMAEKHQAERERLDAGQRARQLAETQERAARLRGGFAGFWDRLTGEHSRTMKKNQMEAYFSLLRDRAQRDDLVIAQMKERRALQERIREVRRQNAQRILAVARHAKCPPRRQAKRPPLSAQGDEQWRKAKPFMYGRGSILRGDRRCAHRTRSKRCSPSSARAGASRRSLRSSAPAQRRCADF
jgi:hypothetical protein